MRKLLILFMILCFSGFNYVGHSTGIIARKNVSAVSGPDFTGHADMVSYWLLDADEDPLLDGTADDRDLSLKGAGEPNYDASFSPNGGYDFDGGNDYAEFDGALGVVAWPMTFYARCRIDVGSSQGHTVLFIGDKSGGTDYIRLQINSSDQPEANVRNNNNFQATSSVAMTEGTWYSLVAVFFSNTSRKIYVNGTERGSDVNSSLISAGLDRVAIGASQDVSPGNFLKGDISEAAYFDDDFTQQEITDISTTGLEGNGF